MLSTAVRRDRSCFIGNSRTFPYGMPCMVREMADSAGAADSSGPHARFARPVASRALGRSEGSEASRGGMGRCRPAGEKRGPLPDLSNEFHNYGALLVQAVANKGGRPVMFVGWNYFSRGFRFRWAWIPLGLLSNDPRTIISGCRAKSGAQSRTSGRVWQSVLNANPPFRLESDGNHPTLHGSYLTALVIYSQLSGKDRRGRRLQAGRPSGSRR